MEAVKLCVVVLHNRDKGRVSDELVRVGFKFTVIGSTGGFLREGNTTILIGCEEAEIENLKSVLAENCQTRDQMVTIPAMDAGPQGGFMSTPVKVTVGGAVLFVLPVEGFFRF